MTFIEYLIEVTTRNVTRKHSHPDYAGTPNHADDFSKEHIAHLNASAKEAKKNAGSRAKDFKHGDFEHKDIDDNLFGDVDLVTLSRDHDIDVKIPAEFVNQEMEYTKRKVERSRQMILDLSHKKRHQNGGKM